MSLPHSAPDELYARRWGRFWCIAVAAGVVLAMLEWSPLAVVLGVALDATCLAVGLLLVRSCLRRVEAEASSAVDHPVGHRALVVVCVLVAVAAFVSVSPTLAVLTVLTAALSSPLVVRLPPAPHLAHERHRGTGPPRDHGHL